MVASKTSILVAAVALGAATAYAAPTTFNKDIALSRREADESALIAREFDDDELYAREFYDDLDARDFEDNALEARDFDDDELYARELYEDELEARDFDDYEDLFARAVEATPSKNSTSTPPSITTSSTSTPSSTSTVAAKNDEHVLAATPTSTTTPSPTSTAGADEEDHYKHHYICKPYVKAYEILMAQSEHKSHEHDNHRHHHQHPHQHQHHHHHHHRHHHHRHHHLTAHKIAEKCGHQIAALVKLAAQEHGKAADATTTHPTESKTLKVQTPGSQKPSGPPATPDLAAPRVQRRSLGDDVYWKRSLAGSLGLDLDYFVKRFYNEDGIEY